MSKMIACCGIDCEPCPARIATIENDDELRAKTAAEWSKMYHAEIPPEAINCVGCNEQGVHISHWDECGIRQCAQEREHDNCAGCPDYSCSKLDEFHKMVPDARAALDAIRKDK